MVLVVVLLELMLMEMSHMLLLLLRRRRRLQMCRGAEDVLHEHGLQHARGIRYLRYFTTSTERKRRIERGRCCSVLRVLSFLVGCGIFVCDR